MENLFKEIQPGQIQDNPFHLIGNEWMLITAGTKDSFNTMTASWGGFGVLWNRNVTFTFIRPQRHTYKFAESSDYYSLTFFDSSHRDILNYCGKVSGRDVDKIGQTNLTPVFDQGEAVYFEQARLVLICKKIYHQDIDPEHFLDPAIRRMYPGQNYHRMYIGEVVKCLAR